MLPGRYGTIRPWSSGDGVYGRQLPSVWHFYEGSDDKYMILTGDVMSANVLIEDIGDISPPRTGKMLNKSISFRIPGPHQALNIFFSAKNGWWTELLRLEEVNGKWVYAILVVRHNASDTQGPVVKRLVSPDYPPNLLVEDRDWVSLAKRYKHPR